MLKLALLLALTLHAQGLIPSASVQLFPNTENSPSIYIISFSLTNALPANSYLLFTMDWYSGSLTPFDCFMVNTTIALQCTNLLTPTFPLTISSAIILTQNPQLVTSKTVAVLVQSSLLANTPYNFQLQLLNVIPNIKSISPSIEVYSVSSNGLIIEKNSEFGAVVNTPPITSLLSVSVINNLNAIGPGSLSTLKAEFTIAIGVTTSLSAFTFVLQSPYSFSLGSSPATFGSSQLPTNPGNPLYIQPTILSYQVVSARILSIVFNEQFVAGRSFILSVSQINSPYSLATSNISIYSLNYNSLTPLEAYEMGYPIQTVTYPLTLTLGLPYSPVIASPLVFYRSVNQAILISIQIPFSVPAGYSLRLSFNNAQVIPGTAFISIQSLTYTPIYSYPSITDVIITQMGPIIVGTVLSLNIRLIMGGSSFFVANAYIDTAAVIQAFTSTNYLYYGSAQGSQIVLDNFINNFYDSTLWTSLQVAYNAVGGYIVISISPNGVTSSGSYITIYFSPNVQLASSFSLNNDCRIGNSAGTCVVTKTVTLSYLALTLQGSATYLASNSNMFPFGTNQPIYLYNILHVRTSSPQYPYPVYMVLYKSNIVNPVTYNSYTIIDVQPAFSTPSGVSFTEQGDILASGVSAYYSYPGFLRFASATPASLNYILQQNEIFTLTLLSQSGFNSFPSVGNQQSYPCTSNLQIQCQYIKGQSSQPTMWDKVVVTFPNNDQGVTPFHVIVPYTNTGSNGNYYYTYLLGIYNRLTKDNLYYYSSNVYGKGGWLSVASNVISTLTADMEGKAGSYRKNVSITVYNNAISTGVFTCLVLSTQWSFFQNGLSTLTTATLAMSNPTFSGNSMAPLSIYMANGMYLTVIPFIYTASTNPVIIYLDNVHMPYSYNLPNYYIYTFGASQTMTSSNSYLMVGANSFYSTPLQSLTVSCLDRAVGVVNTVCTFTIGTTNPLLANGFIRLSLTGMTVSTQICTLTMLNGTSIPVTCSSSSNKMNLTVALSGSQFYPAGTFVVTSWGIGILQSLTQNVLVELRSATGLDVIETGNRIISTTISALQPISIEQIGYSYLTPLSYSTLTLVFYLPRNLYADEDLVFVIGQDLSGVNAEILRLKIIIKSSNGTVLPMLYTLNSNSYRITFSFTDPAQLISDTYTMTINGICTPASQTNGAFSIIFNRRKDNTQTLLSTALVSFPVFSTYVTSNIALKSYFNTEGFSQDIVFTMVNANLQVNSNMIWIVNLPSYYLDSLFELSPYCMIGTAVISCVADPTTPYQLILSNSPKMINAGTVYTITVSGLACPRSIYTNGQYPNRYLFMGVLENRQSTSYEERSLLLPEQGVQAQVSGIISLTNMLNLPSTIQYSFSSLYAVFQMKCNVPILTGSLLYIDLPPSFDNLNNVALSTNIRVVGVIGSPNSAVINRRIEVPITSTISANTYFTVQFPSLPVPKQACTVQMSTIVIFATQGVLKLIYAASEQSGNSAPTLTFIKNPKYISFNNDSTIVVTAGTYSSWVPVTTNTNSAFASNVNINMSSVGFIFQPSSLFIPLGESSGKFRIGAAGGLIPVFYFYQTVKQEEGVNIYTITLNNNIQVTNLEVPIVVPSSISIPIGGCSDPVLITLTQVPFLDVSINFNYNNTLYPPSNFYPNPHTTKSQISFLSSLNNGTLSFCTSSSQPAASIPVTLVLSGTNYKSYSFTPSNVVVFTVGAAAAAPAPLVSTALINQQKTFLDVNFTTNVKGIVYYELRIGTGITALTSSDIQIQIKNGKFTLQSTTDFMQRIYQTQRDQRISQFYQVASTSTLRFTNLVSQTVYTLCSYLENSFSVISPVNCQLISTATWGNVVKAQLNFSRSLTNSQLNNVLCFFTNITGTNPQFLTDLEGNSCGNAATVNNYYNYPGTTFTSESTGTIIYLFTNPYLSSDPSPLAFTNLFSPTTAAITSGTLTAALTPFSITFLSGTYLGSADAYAMTNVALSNALYVSYSGVTYNSAANTITISNVQMLKPGIIYFVLVLYKQISSVGSVVTINIRLNEPPTEEQLLNCQNWLGAAAEGCARAVYSGVAQNVVFHGVLGNSKYALYYAAATEYPKRPILSTSITTTYILTYNSAVLLKLFAFVMIIIGL